MGNLLSGVPINWGFSPGDIFTNGMFLVGAVSAFVLLGIAIKYVPTLINIIRAATGDGGEAERRKQAIHNMLYSKPVDYISRAGDRVVTSRAKGMQGNRYKAKRK